MNEAVLGESRYDGSGEGVDREGEFRCGVFSGDGSAGFSRV